MSVRKIIAFVFLLLGLGMALPGYPAIVITGTRVIYPESSREVNVRLTNVDKAPVLVQSWLDDGHDIADPSRIEVPFVLMPPVSRVEPGKGQTLRIMYTGDELPKDRESVYWLNVLEIPPKPADAGANLLQLAFRTRIKLFYRPDALREDPATVRKQLKWQLADTEGRRVLRLINPTPYYISLSTIELKGPGKEVRFDPGMAPPFGQRDFVAKGGNLKAASPATVRYGVLNDYGSEVEDTANVN